MACGAHVLDPGLVRHPRGLFVTGRPLGQRPAAGAASFTAIEHPSRIVVLPCLLLNAVCPRSYAANVPSSAPLRTAQDRAARGITRELPKDLTGHRTSDRPIACAPQKKARLPRSGAGEVAAVIGVQAAGHREAATLESAGAGIGGAGAVAAGAAGAGGLHHDDRFSEVGHHRGRSDQEHAEAVPAVAAGAVAAAAARAAAATVSASRDAGLGRAAPATAVLPQVALGAVTAWAARRAVRGLQVGAHQVELAGADDAHRDAGSALAAVGAGCPAASAGAAPRAAAARGAWNAGCAAAAAAAAAARLPLLRGWGDGGEPVATHRIDPAADGAGLTVGTRDALRAVETKARAAHGAGRARAARPDGSIALWATRLEFPHPVGGAPVVLEASAPFSV